MLFILEVHMAQVRIPIATSVSKKPRLTASLLSGSQTSVSTGCESTDLSDNTAPISRPYMLRSATDAASAAIDFSKGALDDDVVDSLPSRAFYKTSVCSTSHLEPSFSTLMGSVLLFD